MLIKKLRYFPPVGAMGGGPRDPTSQGCTTDTRTVRQIMHICERKVGKSVHVHFQNGGHCTDLFFRVIA